MAMAARMPMMMMTTRSSMSVKPCSFSSIALRMRASTAVPFLGRCNGEPVPATRRTRRWVPWLCDPTSRRVCPSSGPVRLDDNFHIGRCAENLEASFASADDLLDQVEDLEDRHVERDDHRSHDRAQESDHEWFDERRQ